MPSKYIFLAKLGEGGWRYAFWIFGAFGPTVMGFLNDAFSSRVSMASLSVFALVGALAILSARLFTFNKDKI